MHLSQKNSSAAFEQLNRCLVDVKECQLVNSKFIIFGSKRQRDKLKACFPIDILGSPLCPVESVKNLGVWFHSDFCLSKHVQKFRMSASCFVQLCDYRDMFLTHNASVLVTKALVSSQLDYCNSLFMSLSKFNLHKLKCIKIGQAELYQTPVDTSV